MTETEKKIFNAPQGKVCDTIDFFTQEVSKKDYYFWCINDRKEEIIKSCQTKKYGSICYEECHHTIFFEPPALPS